MSLQKTTASQHRCAHVHQTATGSNENNVRRSCSRCGYNVVHVATNYVTKEAWQKLAQLMTLNASASEAVNMKNGSTTEAEEKNNDQELVKTLLQKIDEQDQQLKVKTGEMNKLEDENKVLRMKVSHLEAELKRHENVMDWHKVDVIGPNKAASS